MTIMYVLLSVFEPINLFSWALVIAAHGVSSCGSQSLQQRLSCAQRHTLDP